MATLSAPSALPRAFLISQPVIGAGSATVESLSSYFFRVAALNDLTPGQMVFGRCTRWLAERHPDFATLRRIQRGGGPRRSLSVSPKGLEFALALSRLVGRSDIRCLHWGATMPDYSFARLTRGWDAWCPDCLRTDLDPYPRMIWEVDQVSCCHEHSRRLLAACSKCGKRARCFRFDGRFTKCPVCGLDRRESPAPSATAGEIAVAKQWDKLVAEVTRPNSETLSGHQVVSGMLGWAGAHGATSIKQQARLLGLSKSTISIWRRRRFQPSLVRLVEVSTIKGLPILRLFSGALTDCPVPGEDAARSKVWRARRISAATRRAIVWKLEALAARVPPISLTRMATMLGVSLATLQQFAPGLCLGISANHAANSRRIKEAKLEWFCRKVDDYVAHCIAERRAPNWRGLSTVFAKPGQLRERTRRSYAKEAIRRAVRDLPLQPEQLELSFPE